MAKEKGSFWKTLNNLHFYKSKGEGLFKVIAITISWCGGVNISNSPAGTLLTDIIAASLFLFATALIMEYVVQLVTEKKFVKKVIPALMTIPSIFVFIVSGGKLLHRPLSVVPFEWIYNATIFPQIIIWIDVLTQIFIEPPKLNVISIGTNLQHLNVEEDDE